MQHFATEAETIFYKKPQPFTAGYDGKEIELWAMPVPRPYMPDGQKVAEAIQKNLEDVGIKSKNVFKIPV